MGRSPTGAVDCPKSDSLLGVQRGVGHVDQPDTGANEQHLFDGRTELHALMQTRNQVGNRDIDET
jgi:hypothetical protein